jgi:hypothetical protein
VLEPIRLFLWTHPWWHAALVLVPPVLVTVFFSWRELHHSAESNRLRAEANGLRQEANHLREESKTSVARIAELQNERNQLERERNSAMAQIAENTKRPLTQAEINALKLRKYLRQIAHVTEGGGYWGGGAEIVEVSEDNILTLFCPAVGSSPAAFSQCVHCGELQIVEAAVGPLQIRILNRYGNAVQWGELRNWDDRKTTPTKPLPKGDNVFYANYVRPGSPNSRRILIYAPTDGNPLYTLATLVDGKDGMTLYGDNVEISKKFAIIQVEYRAEGFRYGGGTGGGAHPLFLATS